VTLVDNAIYVDGVRTQSPATLDETYELLHERKGMAWIGLLQPSEEELRSVADEFSLHPLAVEDALKGHQRAKLERYGSTLFVVLRPAWYLDVEEEVVFGEVHVFVGRDFVVTVRHAERPDLAHVRRRLEAAPGLLALGPESVLYAILDEIADSYAPVVLGLENDIDEIEDQLFRRDPKVSLRIYELLREVIGFQRAVNPLKGMLEALVRGADKYEVNVELQRSLRDVADHVLRVTERVDSFRVLLDNALTVHGTLVTQDQNDEMRRLSQTGIEQNEDVKKISSWAAILFAPTLIASIYGMNFHHMPELNWVFGYPLAIAGMAAMSYTLYRIFKSRKWL